MKKCSHCQELKPYSEFHKNRSTRDGYQHLCILCSKLAYKAWYDRHPETVKARIQRRMPVQRAWRERHREELREYMMMYYLEHRSNFKGYRHKRKSRLRGNGGHFTGTEWLELCARCENKCLCCQRDDLPLVPDHIVPLCKGGSSEISNIQPLCQKCNREKGRKTIDYRLRYE